MKCGLSGFTTAANTTTNNTNSGPEQIVVMIKLLAAPYENTAQSIAIDNEKISALQRYLTEFISSPTDRVLIFCNDGGIPFPNKDIQMPLGGLGVVMDPQHDMLSESRLNSFLNSEEGNMLSTLIVYDSSGKLMCFPCICFCFLV